MEYKKYIILVDVREDTIEEFKEKIKEIIGGCGVYELKE